MPTPSILDPVNSLQALASSFSSNRDGDAQTLPGVPINCSLFPPNPTMVIPSLLSGALDLTWLTKQVRFADAGAATTPLSSLLGSPADLSKLITGGMPTRVPAKGPLSLGNEELPGVPGQLMQFGAQIPMKVDLPVKLNVSWKVLDEAGNLVDSKLFNAPQGLTGPNVNFLFNQLQTAELKTGEPLKVVKYGIEATVELAVTGAPPQTVKLPKLPVLVPAIGIPTMLLLFGDTHYNTRLDGQKEPFVLILVPFDSPLKSLDKLTATLNDLLRTVDGLSDLLKVAGMFTGLGKLINLVSLATEQKAVVLASLPENGRIDDLNALTVIDNPWYKNNIEAEDTISSMIFVGPQGKRATFWNKKDCHDDFSGGAFEVRVGPTLITLLPDLTDDRDGSIDYPICEPSQSLATVRNSERDSDVNEGYQHHWNDMISSLILYP